MANYQTINYDRQENGIALLTINRPDKLNALNQEVLNELSGAISETENADDVKALIITGAGDKAFVAGADITELANLDAETGRKLSHWGQQIFASIENCSKPVAAVVNGYALGGGAELAMACHIRIATPNAVFGLPEVSLGLIPGYGGTQRLTQLVGKAKAFEYILTGGQINAERALKIGLINKLSEDDAIGEANELLGRMLKKGPVAVSKAIAAVNASFTEGGYEKEAELFGSLCETEDFKEGTAAFLEKRKANFKGK